MGYNKGYRLGYREAYFFGKPYKYLNEEQKEIRNKLVSAFRNYKSDLVDIKNKEILLEKDNLSKDQKENILKEINKMKLRLTYLDNLIEPLVRKDKEIVYYKYIEGLTHAEIVNRMPYYGSARSIQSRSLRIVGILALRTDSLIFKESCYE